MRLLALLLVLLCFAGWRYIPRPWKPTTTLESAHYTVLSTAAPEHIQETAQRLETLYAAYANSFSNVAGFQPAPARLKVKLYRDRNEFRKINPGIGWAEAFYLKPYCHAYFSAEEINSYHWMLHEAVHQLNREVAHFRLAKWLEEGVAEYFSTSFMVKDQLRLGLVDHNTYPVWWIDGLATTPDLSANLRNGSVIPLRTIITNRGGPSMRKNVNLYYLHWWTLTYFIFESPKYRAKALPLLEQGGGLKAFETCLGPVDQIQQEWHAYVRELKVRLNGVQKDKLKSNKS